MARFRLLVKKGGPGTVDAITAGSDFKGSLAVSTLVGVGAADTIGRARFALLSIQELPCRALVASFRIAAWPTSKVSLTLGTGVLVTAGGAIIWADLALLRIQGSTSFTLGAGVTVLTGGA